MSERRKTTILVLLGLTGMIFIALVGVIARHQLLDERARLAGFAVIGAALLVFVALRLRDHNPAAQERGLQDPMATFSIVGPFADRKSLLLFSLAVGVGSALLAMSGQTALGALGTMIFGISFPAFLLTRGKVQTLVFSPHGLDYTVFSVGPVVWADFCGARIASAPRPCLVIEVEDELKYWRGTPERAQEEAAQARSIHGSGFVINPADLGTSIGVLMKALDVRLTQFGDRQKFVDDHDEANEDQE